MRPLTDVKQISAPLPPNGTIGLIGGGQLARMLASSAARLGFRTIVLEPGADCPAAQVCNRHIVAAYDDAAALDELQQACDVITYEFENVPLAAEDSHSNAATARVLASCRPPRAPSRSVATSQP